MTDVDVFAEDFHIHFGLTILDLFFYVPQLQDNKAGQSYLYIGLKVSLIYIVLHYILRLKCRFWLQFFMYIKHATSALWCQFYLIKNLSSNNMRCFL